MKVLLVSVAILLGTKASPVQDSQCLTRIDQIFNRPCKHYVISKLVLINSNHPRFEEICTTFLHTLQDLQTAYNHRKICKAYVKPLTEIVTTIKEDPSNTHVLNYIRNIQEVIKFITKHNGRLDEFLKLLTQPEEFSYFLNETREFVTNVRIEREAANYVGFVLNVTRLTKAFIERKYNYNTIVASIIDLGYESIELSNILTDHVLEIIAIQKDGIVRVVEILIGVVQEVLEEDVNHTRTTGLICMAVRSIALSNRNVIDKTGAFANFIINLLNNAREILVPVFADVTSKYFCNKNVV